MKMKWSDIKLEIAGTIAISLITILFYCMWIFNVGGTISDLDKLALGALTMLCLWYWVDTLTDVSDYKNE